VSKRKPRGPYVAPGPATFSLPTERDLLALCAYLERAVPTQDDKDRIVRDLKEWAKPRAGDAAPTTTAAIDQWISKVLWFDPEGMSGADEAELLRAHQLHWLAELLALHYHSTNTAEKKATGLRLKSTRDYYRKLDLAHGVLAAGVLAARLPRPLILDYRALDINPSEDDCDDSDEAVDDEDDYLGVGNVERTGMGLVPTDRPDEFDDFDDSTPSADERDDVSPNGSDDC
jgi:hypothetical protein